ncbi:ppk32 [Candida oxycetoniae]|uniref:Ppk32 n=1 Tax=Candida oxycetoniae TaxID=497107 RepID=A0AAI9T120_9ASCO|nr:ppk32 [Candida oxycetoniae]KAI3406374.2 ppk32 [Candida oxycetoniae]
MLSSLGFKTGIRATYNVSDNPTFVSEPWTIYPAKHKSSGRIVSVFIFDKTRFEGQVSRLCSTSSNTKSPKNIVKECYELIKLEVNQLSKLKHPQILTIIEVLEETRSKFLFVSESIGNNLITVNAKDLDSLSIQKGLLQIAKGLQFLHTQGNIIHLNIQPSSIFINNQGDWKLAGFAFLQNLNELSPQERDNFYIMNNSSVVPFANLNLNFTAPELIIDSQTKLDFANDIWSFGMLIFYLYNYPDMLINSFDANSIQDYKQEFRKFEQKFFNHNPTELQYILKKVPEKLYSLFPRLLARYPYDRLTLDQFIDSDFFNGSVIKAMWFIDEFSTKSIHEKLVFLKGLLEFDPETQTDLISQFPVTFRTSKLLPLLIGVVINELTVLDDTTPIDPNVDDLISNSLEIIMLISKGLSGLTFQDRVYNVLFKDNTTFSEKVYDAVFKEEAKSKKHTKTFTKLINASVKTRLTLVNNLPVLQEKTNSKQFVGFIKSILDLVFTLGAKEQDQKHVQIILQEKFLDYMPKFVEMIEFPYMKNKMFPLLCKIFSSTSVYSTKLKILDTFQEFCDKKVIDKIIIDEQLLPMTKGIEDRNKEMVCKLITFLSKVVISEHINLDMKTSVESILPQCFAFAFGCNDCDEKEFKSYMKSINNVQQHLVDKKLQQLPKYSNGGGGGAARSNKDDSTTVAPNFETLLQNQRIKEPEKEISGPKTKAIQPNKKLSSASSIGKRSVSNPTNALNATPLRPMEPRRKFTTTTVRNGSSSSSSSSSNTTTSNKPFPNLTFGATNQASNSSNAKLFDSLKSTYERQKQEEEEGEDDDFDDFLSADQTLSHKDTSKVKNEGKINWMSEVNKMKTLPNTPQPNAAPKSIKNKYPPGFDSNAILSPKSSMPIRAVSTTILPTSNQNKSEKINPALLDLL